METPPVVMTTSLVSNAFSRMSLTLLGLKHQGGKRLVLKKTQGVKKVLTRLLRFHSRWNRSYIFSVN